MKSRCCCVNAKAARWLSDSALAITRRKMSLMLRSSWANPGSAQIAFSTWRLAVAQLKLAALRLIAVDAHDVDQPILHRLAQIIARPPELGIAAGDVRIL